MAVAIATIAMYKPTQKIKENVMQILEETKVDHSGRAV
jgi:hypothetical protein